MTRDMQKTSRRAAYTLAAGAAAGLAGQTDADASSISFSGPQDIDIAQFGSLDLNIDGDAFTDVLLKNYVFAGGNYQGASVNGAPGQLAISNGSFPYYVTALSEGDLIDSTTVGPSFAGSLAYSTVNPNAEFGDIDGGLIGLSFPIGGNAPQFLHFGWIRVSIDNAAGTFVVNEWAYNTVPGEGILAGQVPEPSTLGLLAAGALGVGAMRRRRDTHC
ncbi:MAG: PEP-CTERM sorting domain-containing protein [Planctomycetota bacterium]